MLPLDSGMQTLVTDHGDNALILSFVLAVLGLLGLFLTALLRRVFKHLDDNRLHQQASFDQCKEHTDRIIEEQRELIHEVNQVVRDNTQALREHLIVLARLANRN